MLNVILADDDTLVREGLKMLLLSDNSFQVVGEAGNGQEVLDLINGGLAVDIVLTDVNMPVMDGIALIKPLRALNEKIKVIILSMVDTNKSIEQAFTAGASGYLLKTVSPEELLFAIKKVNQGKRYLCSDLTLKLLERSMEAVAVQNTDDELPLDLTSREKEVLFLIAEGLTNNEISDKLFLSKRTIEGHRQSLIEKTGCRNTASLIKFSILNGIIQ
ncbi:response regulator transcription factor [Pedobacter sp.]|uniref:response regulator transcription factor n=1 Tax=Pedobacter sp. TaxID=1411316 RepID=UPI003D7FEA9D